MSNEPAWIADVVFDADGLIPAIAQDADNGQIMMVAWMNRESLAETAATGRRVLVAFPPAPVAQGRGIRPCAAGA